jgi:dihydrofolate reductase
MRRLLVGCLLTLDGVHDAPRSWAGPYFDADAARQSLDQLERTDAMLMGAGTYRYFATTWPYESGPYPDRMNAIRKHVFSSTLTSTEWNNSVLVRDDPVAAVTRLKAEGGGDLVVYGCGRLSQTLLDHDLVDELTVSLFPVIQGSGRTMQRTDPRRLELVSVTRNPVGTVSLTYVRG